MCLSAPIWFQTSRLTSYRVLNASWLRRLMPQTRKGKGNSKCNNSGSIICLSWEEGASEFKNSPCLASSHQNLFLSQLLPDPVASDKTLPLPASVTSWSHWWGSGRYSFDSEVPCGSLLSWVPFSPSRLRTPPPPPSTCSQNHGRCWPWRPPLTWPTDGTSGNTICFAIFLSKTARSANEIESYSRALRITCL